MSNRTQYYKKYYKEHKEERLKHMKHYHDNHREEQLIRMKKYDKEHKEELKPKKKEWYETHCNECKDRMKVYWERYYKKNKEQIIRKQLEWYHARIRKYKRVACDILGGKCQKCGYDKCFAALEFHHRESDEKDQSVSKLWKRKWSIIKEEIKKCDLLCANCHRELHYQQYCNI